jgi:hypothetical protein
VSKYSLTLHTQTPPAREQQQVIINKNSTTTFGLTLIDIAVLAGANAAEPVAVTTIEAVTIAIKPAEARLRGADETKEFFPFVFSGGFGFSGWGWGVNWAGPWGGCWR